MQFDRLFAHIIVGIFLIAALCIVACTSYVRTEQGYKAVYEPLGESTPQPSPEVTPTPSSKDTVSSALQNQNKEKSSADATKDAGGKGRASKSETKKAKQDESDKSSQQSETKGIKETDLSKEAEGGQLEPAGQPAPIPLITTLVPAPPPQMEGNEKRKASISLVLQGREATAMNRFDEAERNFEDAISVDPQNPYAYYFFAETRFVAGNYEQSANLCDKAVELAPTPQWKSRALVLRAKNMANLRNYNKAALDCDAAIAEDSSNVEARLLIVKLRR